MGEVTPHKYLSRLPVVAVFLFCLVPLFYHLGTPAIFMWDEATYANNAIDMYRSNDPIVVRMEGHPDLYNTKPPLVLWMQTLSMHLFGLNEFAIRFPSAFFSALILLLLLWFCVAVLHSNLAGIFAMLTLAGSNGFVSSHGSRSGDLDAIMVFWMTLYALVFIKFLIEKKDFLTHFLVISAGITGAFLSKGVAGFFFIPFLILLAIVDGSFLLLFRKWELYLLAIIVFTICFGYYFVREKAAPGYWDKVLSSEWSRYGKSNMSWQVQPLDFYLRNFFSGRFTPFVYLLPFSAAVWLVRTTSTIKKVALYCWILSLGYLLLISFPADKLGWYDEPVYPQFALIIAITLVTYMEMLSRLFREKYKKAVTLITLTLFLLVLLFIPYKNFLANVVADEQVRAPWDTSQTDVFRIHGAYMKHLKEQMPQLKNYTVLKALPYDTEYDDQAKFYERTYHVLDSSSIQIKHFNSQISTGDTVLVCDKNESDSLQGSFKCTLLNSWNGCELFYLAERKQK